jgi:hypothetical protein
MKKLWLSFLIVTIAIMLTLPLIALAEASTTPTVANTPFTWDYILSLPGSIAAVLLIIQFTKAPLDKVGKIPTRWFVLILAVVVQLLATAYTTGLTPAGIPLLCFNAFIVATSAMGTYELTFAKLEARSGT